MKEEVIWLRDWRNAAEIREALLAWRVRYNTQRPHQALGWKTPAEYRAEKLSLAVDEAAWPVSLNVPLIHPIPASETVLTEGGPYTEGTR